MTVPDLVPCVPSPFGKPLFVLEQLFAFSFLGSFLSARPPPCGGGLLGLDGVRVGFGVECMVGPGECDTMGSAAPSCTVRCVAHP